MYLILTEEELRRAVEDTNKQDWVSESDIDFLTYSTALLLLNNLGISVIRDFDTQQETQ